MSSLDEIFSAAKLDVLVPDVSVGFPGAGEIDGDAWLGTLKACEERKQAFFDEHLDFLLLLKIEHPSLLVASDDTAPPPSLLSILSQAQVSVDATYISPMPAAAKPSPRTPGFLVAPPIRTASAGRLRPRVNGGPPVLFPPATPNPTPLTGKDDEQYVKAEGTLLQTFVWGENTSETSREAVAILRSAKQNAWVIVFRLAIGVLFLRTNIAEPLLCLTVSTTLRERALSLSPTHPTSTLLAFYGGIPSSYLHSSAAQEAKDADDIDLPDYVGLEEVNLLGGLIGGPTFGNLDSLELPSTRLGPSTRRRAYNLSPRATASKRLPAVPTPATVRPPPTIRKSFRKTLHTVSAFRVRMRTVFVPYVLMSTGDSWDEEGESEASNEERTVVLCVEIENGGDSLMGFAVENVNVVVGGSGATAKLITWGDKGIVDSQNMWPLHVRPMEQFNLLYAVSFTTPSEVEEIALPSREKPKGGAELQRAVTINIQGRPYALPADQVTDQAKDTVALKFQTHAFSSRWNCVLDLSPQRARDSIEVNTPKFAWDAMPAPASPFPVSSPQAKTAKEKLAALHQIQTSPAIAGTKRHTLGGAAVPRKPALVNWRASTSAIEQVKHRKESNLRLSFTPPPPSIAVKAYSSQPSSPIPTPGSVSMTPPPGLETAHQEQYAAVPPTPAYPAYSNTPLPPTPEYQVPLSMQQNQAIGHLVDMRHSGRPPLSGYPSTPGPRMAGPGGFFTDRMSTLQDAGGVPIVVSVALLSNAGKSNRLYPLDEFTLDIFVFNQSSITRRFEVSYPDRKRRRHERDDYYSGPNDGSKAHLSPAIIPLENRIRVGPLYPTTCQSVRMQFLALRPGVHSIDALIFTDTQSGSSINLRSVTDVVVHEAEDSDEDR